LAEHMTPGSIRHLVRLHDFTITEARRLLRRCLSEQATAQTALTEAVRSIARETERVMTGSGDDREVESFAAWLGRSRRMAGAAEARLGTAAADTAIARAALGLAEAASASADILMTRRRQAERPCGSRS